MFREEGDIIMGFEVKDTTFTEGEKRREKKKYK